MMSETAIRPLVAGNWKMNGTTAALREPRLLGAMLKGVKLKCDVLVCPPATILRRAKAVMKGGKIKVGGQDCHAAASGAHTGDISAEMLRSARAKLPGRIALAQGDACDFDAGALVGIARFDRILLSYSLSMIPDWKAALRCAARHLADGGELHVVDFGGQAELPDWFHAGLTAWLARFHVSPRASLADELDAVAGEIGGRSASRPLYRDYARYGAVARPGPTDARPPSGPDIAG